MKYDSILALMKAGMSEDDARSVRRISMTLQRWHELECGDGNNYGSWAIVRGYNTDPFTHNDDGYPYLEHHHYLHGRGKDYVSYTKLADKEKGALKRLQAIMARYPALGFYVQGDPRGASLYILRPGDVPAGETAESYYSRGVAVYK